MSGEEGKEKGDSPHIELIDDHPSARHDGDTSPGMRNSKGWDGKLRMERSATVTNPEVLSDPESDDENVLPGDELPADEGESHRSSREIVASYRARAKS